MEVESALVDHPAVAEAAVIGKAHDIKGQAIASSVILRAGFEVTDGLVNELKAHVARKETEAIARPDDLFISAELPKTRSGKIMRRFERRGRGAGVGRHDYLADPAVVAALKDKYEATEG